jgi:hypothetical protein
VSALKLKIERPSSVLDGMPVANTMFPAEEVARFQYLRWQCGKHLSIILAIKGSFFTFFEELKNIENRVAWFLGELCKAKNSVQKDKANQHLTELVRGCLAPRLAHGIDLLKQNEYSQNKRNSRVAIFS